MKRALQAFALLLWIGLPAAAAQRKDDVAIRDAGSYLASIPGAHIRVCTNAATGTVCTPLAPVCTDRTLATCSTLFATFDADAHGNYHLYAAAGLYKLQITDPSTGAIITQSDVNIPPSTDTSNVWPAAQFFKRGPVIDVMGWGCKVDGSDETPSGCAQDAANAAELVGASLKIPGTTAFLGYCGRTIDRVGGLTIFGDGGYSNIGTGTGGTPGSKIACIDPNQNTLNVTNGANVTIRDLSLLGARAWASQSSITGTGNALEVDAHTNTIRGLHLENVITAYAPNHGTYFHGGSGGSSGFLFDLKLSHVQSTNNGGDGFKFFGRTSETLVDGAYSDANGGNCYTVDGGNGGVSGIGEALGVHLVGVTSGQCQVAFLFKDARAVSLLDFWIEHPTVAGIQLQGCRYCSIKNANGIVSGSVKNIEFLAGATANDYDEIDVPGWINASSHKMLTYTGGTVQGVQLGRHSAGRFDETDVEGTPFFEIGRSFIFADSPVIGTRNLAIPGTSYSSGKLSWQASYNNGADVPGRDDYVYAQLVPQSTGANPQMVLQFSHVGSTGFPHGIDFGSLALNPLSDLTIGSASTGTIHAGINKAPDPSGSTVQVNGLTNVGIELELTSTQFGKFGQGSWVFAGKGSTDLGIGVAGANHLWFGANNVPSMDVTSTGVAVAGGVSSSAGFAGAGSITVTLGLSTIVGTSASAPACLASHACDQFSGAFAFTAGTGPSVAGNIVQINFPVTRTNIPNCSLTAYDATSGSPLSVLPDYSSATTSFVWVQSPTTLTASHVYNFTYVCGG